MLNGWVSSVLFYPLKVIHFRHNNIRWRKCVCVCVCEYWRWCCQLERFSSPVCPVMQRENLNSSICFQAYMLSRMKGIPCHRHLSGVHFGKLHLKKKRFQKKTFADKREMREWCSARPKKIFWQTVMWLSKPPMYSAVVVRGGGGLSQGLSLNDCVFPLIPPSNEWVITRHLHNYIQRQSSATCKAIGKMRVKEKTLSPVLPRRRKHGGKACAVSIGCTHAIRAELCPCATGQVWPCALADTLSSHVSGSLLVPWINFVCPLETRMSR